MTQLRTYILQVCKKCNWLTIMIKRSAKRGNFDLLLSFLVKLNQIISFVPKKTWIVLECQCLPFYWVARSSNSVLCVMTFEWTFRQKTANFTGKSATNANIDQTLQAVSLPSFRLLLRMNVCLNPLTFMSLNCRAKVRQNSTEMWVYTSKNKNFGFVNASVSYHSWSY